MIFALRTFPCPVTFVYMQKNNPEELSQDAAMSADGAASRVPAEIYARSKFLILLGVLLLVVGSGLLMLCKLPLPELAATLAAFAGGGLILFGNGTMIYGLLVYAGWHPD